MDPKVFLRIISSHRYENLLCEAEREVGRIQVLIDDDKEAEEIQAQRDREAGWSYGIVSFNFVFKLTF